MTEALLNQQIQKQVREVFQQLKEPVEVLFFGKAQDCETCSDTLQLIQEIAKLSDKLTLTVYDVDTQPEAASQYHIDKLPGLVIAARDSDKIIDYGIRYAGIPSGHEFSSLIQDLVLVSGRDSGLGADTRENLKKLTKPVRLQVFVTPT